MPPPFRPRMLDDFIAELNGFNFGRVALTGVHVHHTYRPDHATYKRVGGEATVAGMHRYHTASLGWSDIAQHESVGPEGLIWSGRSWLRSPASSRGYNGTKHAHPFMFEMIGDFETVADQKHDILTAEQRKASIGICAAVCQRFDLRPGDTVKFHRELAEKWKSCPGDTIDKEPWVADVEAAMNGDLSTAEDLGLAVGGAVYTVRAGDNLWRIAQDNGLSLLQLCEWNDIPDTHPIHPGDTLRIPA